VAFNVKTKAGFNKLIIDSLTLDLFTAQISMNARVLISDFGQLHSSSVHGWPRCCILFTIQLLVVRDWLNLFGSFLKNASQSLTTAKRAIHERNSNGGVAQNLKMKTPTLIDVCTVKKLTLNQSIMNLYNVSSNVIVEFRKIRATVQNSASDDTPTRVFKRN